MERPTPAAAGTPAPRSNRLPLPFDANFMHIEQAEQKIFLVNSRQDLIVAFVLQNKVKLHSSDWPDHCLTLQFQPGQAASQVTATLPNLDADVWFKMVGLAGAVLVWVYLPALFHVALEPRPTGPMLIFKCRRQWYCFDETTFGAEVQARHDALKEAKRAYAERLDRSLHCAESVSGRRRAYSGPSDFPEVRPASADEDSSSETLKPAAASGAIAESQGSEAKASDIVALGASADVAEERRKDK